MVSKLVKPLRVLVIIVLVMLFFQYELGIQVIMSNPPSINPFPFSIQAVSQALHGVGTVAVIHAAWGGLLLVMSLVVMVVSLLSRRRAAQVFGTLAFLAILSAAYGGLGFVLSGFQNDNQSHNMATNLLASFTFYFLELYVLKGSG